MSTPRITMDDGDDNYAAPNIDWSKPELQDIVQCGKAFDRWWAVQDTEDRDKGAEECAFHEGWV